MTNQELIRRVEALLMQISYLDYAFAVGEGHGGVYLVGEYTEPDIHTSLPEVQKTRRWLLTPKMTDSEIVSTIFKCCITSAEHRCREAFQYKGARVFGPHFDVEDLVVICKDGRGENGGRKAA